MPTITDFFGKASVDTDHSVATTITADRTSGVTVLNCFDMSTFTEDTPVYFVTYTKTTDPLTSEVTITDTISWKGLVNAGANTITNLTIAPGYVDTGNTDGQFVECIPTSYWVNELVDGIQTEHNPDGTHSDITATTVTADEFILTGTAGATQGWQVGLPAVSSVTANGNRSYDVPFASDVSATLSEGMRLEFTKTVAGNGYMGGAFNGSSHYFTKTSPSGTLGTVTNNFTIEAYSRPGAYAIGMLCGRFDAGANNGLYLRQEADGTITCAVHNGAGNSRSVTTHQSVSLTKSQHITASWASGTVVIYFDGISVPVKAATTTGTAPTTAGTGGDWSIGRAGAFASQYYNGYISNVAVFDAVLSAATILQHSTYKLTGSETNCIGAWSLDNTANDQSSAGNNLTATGGVGFTAQSPHGQLGSGVDTTKSVGLVMSVSGSTAVVQVPEGCTIPTSGGITSVAYSTQANPYGWVSDKGRWTVELHHKTSNLQSSPVGGTWYNVASLVLSVPQGNWGELGYKAQMYLNRASGDGQVGITLSTANNTDSSNGLFRQLSGTNPTTDFNTSLAFSHPVKTTAVTPYYLNIYTPGAGHNSIYLVGQTSTTVIKAIPSGI